MDDNPYAPSRTDDVAEAPPSHGWEVRGGSLWVEQNAVLPMIDPFSGDSPDRMELYRLNVRWRLMWARSLFLGGLLVLALFEGDLRSWHRSAFLAVTTTGLLVGLFAMLFRGPVRIQVFLAPSTAARRKIAQGVMLWSIIAFALIAMAPLFVGRVPPWGLYVQQGLLGAVILTAIWTRWLRRRLICRRRSGPLHELRGVHPAALRELTRVQEAGRGR